MLSQFELSILDWVQATFRCGFLDILMPIITFFGEGGLFWIAAALILMAIPKTRKLGLSMAVALLLDVVLCNLILKPLVARPRPYIFRPELDLLVERLSDYSFPSGHTMASFAAAGALAFSRSRLSVPALIIAVLVGLSRLYLYVHFPTDVLGGALLGLLCGYLGVLLAQALIAWRSKRLQES